MRNHWGSRLGFILAAVGSAVGLGNIWKFPFITGMNGGGAFVLVYLVAILLCGLPLLMAEFAIGRHSQKDVVGSFAALTPKKGAWKIVGWINLIAAFIILSYYGVIAGWTLDYLVKALTGSFAGQSADSINAMFGDLVTSPGRQMIYLTIFSGLCLLAVRSGVRRGIERWNKILMPSLFVIIILLAIYALTTEGAREGVIFMLYPDFSKLTSQGVLEAIGHSFFTLSLGMGAMITYASYMDKKEEIYPVAIRIAAIDTIVAIVAGLAIFPIVFAVGMTPNAGPGLIFKTLPQVFSTLPFGSVIAVFFFVLMAFAALSSAISLLEVLTAYVIDEKKVDRKKATIIMTILVYIAGIPSALSYSVLADFKPINGMEVLDSLDYIASNYMLPIGGLLIAIYTGFILDKRIAMAEITEDGKAYVTVFKIWYVAIRYVTPILVGVVFLKSIGILG
ncbi:MAG: sodium-dependent transporter [Desulfotalea sp.]